MRQDVITKTIDRVEGEFEELRAELLGDLERFEGELKTLVSQFPEWLELGIGSIREVLRFPEESGLGSGLLGPRIVAIMAGKVQEFVRVWVGSADEVARPKVETSAQAANDYHRELAVLRHYIDQVEHTSHEVSQEAQEVLCVWRDEILDELETQRMEDADALEALVAEGTIEQGRNVRAEIASLWEEQRHRAEHLAKVWAPMLLHADRGLKLTLEGIDELRSLLEHVHQGMCEGYPVLCKVKVAHDAMYSHDEGYGYYGGGGDDADDADEAPSMELALQNDEYELEEIVLPKPRMMLDDVELDGFDPYGSNDEDMSETTHQSAQAMSSSMSMTVLERARQQDDGPIHMSEGVPEGPMIDFFEDEDEVVDTSAFYIAHAAAEDHAVPGPPDTAQDYDVFQSIDDPSKLSLLLANDDVAEVMVDDVQGVETLKMHARVPEVELARSEDLEVEDSVAFGTSTQAPAQTSAQISAQTHDSWETMRIDEEDDELIVSIVEDDDAGHTVPALHKVAAAISSDRLTYAISSAQEHETGDDFDTLMLSQTTDPDALDTRIAQAGEEERQQKVRDDVVLVLADSEYVNPESVDTVEQVEQVEQVEPVVKLTAAHLEEDKGKDAHMFPCMRVRKELAPTSRLELAAFFVVPFVLLLGLIGQTYVMGALDADSWLLRISLLLLVWLVLCPLIMRWKLAWKGWVPVVLRQTDFRDDTEMLLNHDGLDLGPWSMRWDEIKEASRSRWEQDGQGRGFMLELIHESGDRHAFVVHVDDEDEWSSSSWPQGSIASGAWSIDENAWHALTRSYSVTLHGTGKSCDDGVCTTS